MIQLSYYYKDKIFWKLEKDALSNMWLYVCVECSIGSSAAIVHFVS